MSTEKYLAKLRRMHFGHLPGIESPYVETLRLIWEEDDESLPQIGEKERIEVVRTLNRQLNKRGRREIVREVVKEITPKSDTPSLDVIKRLITEMLPKPQLRQSKEEIAQMIKEAMPNIPKAPSSDDLISLMTPLVQQALLALPREAVKPTYDEIVGAILPVLDEKIRLYRRGWFGGGGDRVGAGVGITITRNGIGRKIINATSTGVGAWSTPPETPDSIITVFTVGATPPTDVVADGTDFYEGQGYTYAAGQLTFTNPPNLYVRYR